MFTARSYQSECIEHLYKYFATHKDGHPVCALPTGTGKAVIIALFLQSIYAKWYDQKVLVVTHVKELVDQNYKKFMGLWPNAPAGINSAGLGRRDTRNRIIFGGIGSMYKDASSFGKVDLLIIDEAHLVSPNAKTMYRTFINALLSINPRMRVIGFTATPWRIGQGMLTDEDGLFTDICFDITGLTPFNRLIEEGFLAPLIPKKTKFELDISGVGRQAGDFIASQQQLAVDKEAVTRAALEEMVEEAKERKHWMIFAAGTDHSDHIAEMLTYEFGIPAVSIHSKIKDDERDKRLKAYLAGEYRCAVNNNVLTTGIDFPALDCIGVLRATESPVLWVQMLGRGTRPCPGKEDCLVLDFARNSRRLGPINDPKLPRKKGKGGGEAPIKECPMCSTYNHPTVKFCIKCGYQFTFEVKIQQTASTDELIRSEIPIVESFKVDHITYDIKKRGQYPSMEVAYYCGFRVFYRQVCFEHPDGNYARVKACEWWRERGLPDPVPRTVKEALAYQEFPGFPPSTHLKIWVNKKYPEILKHCFDGTNFGEHEPTPGPTSNGPDNSPTNTSYEDDDIPF